MARTWRLSLAGAGLLVLLGLLLIVTGAGAQEPWRYFPETGYWVGNEFLTFFDERGGLDIFGYPIDNATTEYGMRVQYFQRARMELHVSNPPAYRVQLGLLGMDLCRENCPPVTPVPPNLRPSPNDPHAHYFPQTGQVVKGAFWDYYRSRGGLDIFGPPISPEFLGRLSGRPVQYFQRARMEWWPENPEPYIIQLGLLGQEWLDWRASNPPMPTPPPPPTPTPLPGRTATPTPGATPTPVRTPSPGPTPTPWPPGNLPLDSFLLIVLIILLVAIVGGFLWWRRDQWQDWRRERQKGEEPPADTNLETPRN